MANSYSRHKRNYKKVEKAYKKLPTWAKVVAIILALAIVAGAVYYYFFIYKKKDVFIPPEGSVSFHFLMLGNAYAGDCTLVKVGDVDVLIDAGSRKDSIDDIQNYIDNYVTDGKLEYVIATHGDQDHIAGFAKDNGSIFDIYECETIIDFPRTDKDTDTYNDYVAERDAEVSKGAKHYTALDCYNQKNGGKRVYNLTENGNVKMEILYNYFYENKSVGDGGENEYSVCVMFYHGSRKFLFTGDLEEKGEEYLAQNYDFSQVELFKAGHHGSKTSSNEILLKEIKPKICVASCCAGSVEYTQNFENTFPTQAFINRIAKYTDKVYVPIMIDVEWSDRGTSDTSDDKYENVANYEILNGNIVVVSEAEKDVYVNCSNNNTILKDTEWFKNNRTMPSYWLS